MTRRLRPRRLFSSASTARERALDTLAMHRRHPEMSLSAAARLTHTAPSTVLQYAGHGYRREGRRYRPRPFDRIPREMSILTPSGPELLVVHDSRTASKIANQRAAVTRYRNRGDDRLLLELGRSTVTVNGRTYQLQLDTDTLDRLIEGAELHYELYAR